MYDYEMNETRFDHRTVLLKGDFILFSVQCTMAKTFFFGQHLFTILSSSAVHTTRVGTICSRESRIRAETLVNGFSGDARIMKIVVCTRPVLIPFLRVHSSFQRHGAK